MPLIPPARTAKILLMAWKFVSILLISSGATFLSYIKPIFNRGLTKAVAINMHFDFEGNIFRKILTPPNEVNISTPTKYCKWNNIVFLRHHTYLQRMLVHGNVRIGKTYCTKLLISPPPPPCQPIPLPPPTPRNSPQIKELYTCHLSLIKTSRSHFCHKILF